MRGTARRAKSVLSIDLRSFGWERAAVAALRHSTLPWLEQIETAPLDGLREIGTRDRLSLVAQFAAHQAFLQFAGIREGHFAVKQWAIARKRGTDVRLIRIAGGSPAADPDPPLTAIQEFALAVAAPSLESLRRSWARADTVYGEIESKLRADAAADLRWLRASAFGCVASPGPETMRILLASGNGRFQSVDPLCFESLKIAAAAGEAVVLLGERASPLERYSAVADLQTLIGPFHSAAEDGVVERVLAAVAQTRCLFALTNAESFDESSRRVADLLLASGAGVWVGGDGAELPESTWFLVSPRLAARRDFEGRLAQMPVASRQSWVQALIEPQALGRYLDDGELPAPPSKAFSELREPFRSYLGAAALLGPRVPAQVLDRFLERLQSNLRASDLAFPGISRVDAADFAFVSDEVHQEGVQSIPPASRPSLIRVAAELLETVDWTSPQQMIRTLRRFPVTALPAQLQQRLAAALVECGRYVDAKALTSDDLLLARIERRMGDYTPAIDRLERMGVRDFEAELLYAELLMLAGGNDAAAAALDRCRPTNPDQRVRHGYQRAVLALDTGAAPDDSWLAIDSSSRDYFASRFAVYRAVASKDLDEALRQARNAAAAARAIPERIDASLDLLFVLFSSGRWPEARAAALDALLLADEAQGDRVAGGILFLLAYLAADDGQSGHASHLLERLRRFYGGVRDERRLAELQMISAQIDFGRARFDSAMCAAEGALSVETSDQIREAAALIADEIDWIEGCDTPLRSTGRTANRGLTDRHQLLRARRGLDRAQPQGAFASALLDWETHGGEPPAPKGGTEKLMLFRSARGLRRTAVAEAIARELKVAEPVAEQSAEEVRIFRSASVAPFPFARGEFGPVAWRYASRNRLGQWQEIGSGAPLGGEELDRLLAQAARDWIACSDHELFYLAGLHAWPAESRDAIGALIRIRAEHYRLQRLTEEEPQAAVQEPLEGIVGMSEVMRELCSVVGRIARRDVPVCVLGESGTGKELVARAIHRLSARRHKPFTPVNCAALPEHLIESELFGHVRGAFTGADRDRPGLIEASDAGTLFLDEIGEMPLPAQAKLLRFLQEGEFRRVGESAGRTADVRVVAATNRKLEAAVEQGRFREDLYYRIRGVEIVVPPLRDRGTDIGVLAAHFLTAERQKHRSGPSRLSPEAEAAFASYHWPGNVRELQNTIRAAHVLAGEGKQIELEHLPERLRGKAVVRTPLGSYQDAVARFRRELIERSLAQANGNQNQAAAMLKISRQALAYQIRELGILVTRLKPSPA